mgnify:CR=1 FL=1
MKKKVIALLLATTMAFSLAACGGGNNWGGIIVHPRMVRKVPIMQAGVPKRRSCPYRSDLTRRPLTRR